ncbi:hypothetical protein CYMTET_40013 [Cymbomonas tetramitiformis]|uniref:Uncharacterized protein n=1 Tax=Cymbomonas tetramitiformis TaxID=36881 RepID=A0AAE0CAA8_9CHLO|nr:hypothetical protein CYMTET_40013 [Cymbomonas tetramitiformis]
MSTARQRARMAAVHSTVVSLRLRRQHLTVGCHLVVSGGAHAPDANFESNITIVDNNFDLCELDTPHSTPPPGASLGCHLVVSGGVLTSAHAHLDTSLVTFAKCEAFVARTHRIFNLRPSPPPTASHSFWWCWTALVFGPAWALVEQLFTSAALGFFFHRERRRRLAVCLAI